LQREVSQDAGIDINGSGLKAVAMMEGSTGFLDAAVEAAMRSKEVIMGNLGRLTSGDVMLKHASDFVTRVDRESESAILEVLKSAFPGHVFLSEEKGPEGGSGIYRWIIDPLDGTTNYIHGYPMFSVSIALEHGGGIVAGVVLDPLREELFTAEKGRGARLNGSPLRVSGPGSMAGCLITTGFPFRRKEMLDLYLEAFKRIFLKVSGIRRAGSAALDLAHLAAGRCDGFFELGLGPWDIAAGSLLVTEAGGLLADFGGGGEYLLTGNVVAGAPAVLPELLTEIKGVFGGIINK
jgi:myo-inositol-1(or 4)-monophosphatase